MIKQQKKIMLLVLEKKVDFMEERLEVDECITMNFEEKRLHREPQS
jgi:hypothetical protein